MNSISTQTTMTGPQPVPTALVRGMRKDRRHGLSLRRIGSKYGYSAPSTAVPRPRRLGPSLLLPYLFVFQMSVASFHAFPTFCQTTTYFPTMSCGG